MAQESAQCIRIRDVLTRFLPRHELEELAAEAGVMKRARKVQVHALFWTLVLGFGTGRERTLAALRRAFALATEVRLAPSSFYDRFTPAFQRFIKAAAGRVLARVSETSGRLAGTLASFRDLVIADATVIRLHDLLFKAFPACRTNHTRAAVKLHAVLSVCGAGPRAVRVTSERVHDGKMLRIGRWVAGKLLLFDLAYFHYQLFARIERNGGYFITRLKKSANPRIVGLHRRWRGRAVPLLGQRIWDVVDRLKRRTLDAEVEVSFSRRSYAGRRRRAVQRLRLVGVQDPQTREYHLYLTNIPPARLSPGDIAQTYAARWLVELFFRELKSRYRAEDMPSRKRVIVETLLYSVILTVAVSRALLAAVRARLGALGARVPEERWAVLFAIVARELLAVVVGRARAARALERSISRTLCHEAVDPNRGRARLRQRVEAGTQFDHMFTRRTQP
jgi:IS4 transposase